MQSKNQKIYIFVDLKKKKKKIIRDMTSGAQTTGGNFVIFVPISINPLCIVHTLKTKHDTFKCKLYLQLGLDNNSISIYIFIAIYSFQ